MSNHLHIFTKTKSRSRLVRSVYLSILRAPPLTCTYSPTYQRSVVQLFLLAVTAVWQAPGTHPGARTHDNILNLNSSQQSHSIFKLLSRGLLEMEWSLAKQ